MCCTLVAYFDAIAITHLAGICFLCLNLLHAYHPDMTVMIYWALTVMIDWTLTVMIDWTLTVMIDWTGLS